MRSDTNAAGPPGDAELVAEALAGRQRAFGLLVRRYQGAAIARAYSFVHDLAEAEDVAQDAFLRAYRSLRQLRNPGSFAPWLLQTVSNVARRAARKYTRRPGPLGESSIAPDVARRRELLDAVAALPEGHQEVVHLHYTQGYSCSEIASILGLHVGTVTSRLTRARRRLRELLSEDEAQ